MPRIFLNRTGNTRMCTSIWAICQGNVITYHFTLPHHETKMLMREKFMVISPIISGSIDYLIEEQCRGGENIPN